MKKAPQVKLKHSDPFGPLSVPTSDRCKRLRGSGQPISLFGDGTASADALVVVQSSAATFTRHLSMFRVG